MIKSWYMNGTVYHELKKEFKKIRDKYGFEWLGVAQSAWKNRTDRIELVANRALDDDTGKEYTVDAWVMWKGPNLNDCAKDLLSHFKGFEKKYDGSAFKQPPKHKTEADLKKDWEKQTKIIIENMVRAGKTQSAIKHMTQLRYFEGIMKFGYKCPKCNYSWRPDDLHEKCPKCKAEIE